MVKIGVTGHRFLKETNKIIKAIDEALKRVEKKFGPPFIMFSALGEGADCLVVHRAQAMREDTQLIALLPLRLEDFMEDFSSLVSKVDFINLVETADQLFEQDEGGSRTQRYLLVGKQILDQCDVLIAVWDGKTSQGEGGTAEVVALARERGLPLAWIHAGNRLTGTNKPTSLGESQGKVTYERFD